MLTDNKRQKEKGPFFLSSLRSFSLSTASAPRTVPGARLSARAPRGTHILPLPRPLGGWGPESPHTRRQRPGGRWPPLPTQGPAFPGTHPSREWTPASSRRGRGRLAGSTGAGGEGQREPTGPPLAQKARASEAGRGGRLFSVTWGRIKRVRTDEERSDTAVRSVPSSPQVPEGTHTDSTVGSCA